MLKTWYFFILLFGWQASRGYSPPSPPPPPSTLLLLPEVLLYYRVKFDLEEKSLDVKLKLVLTLILFFSFFVE